MKYPKRISSSITLLLKLFVPIFWVVFFGSFAIGLIFFTPENMAIFRTTPFKWGMSIFFITGIVFLYFTFFQLKRVEIDPDFIYVTDYFKNYRYPFHNIQSIKEVNLLLFYLCTIRFKEKGSFGRKIHFLESRIKFKDALEKIVDFKIVYENSKLE